MIKNFIIAIAIAAGFTGMILISSGQAEADRDRSKFSYIGKAGWCDVYASNQVYIVNGKDCAVAAR